MKIIEFLHDDDHPELPSNVDVWARVRGFEPPHRLRINRGEQFPRLASFDLAVLHGGRQHLWNKDADPWLYGEVEYVRLMLSAGKPVVGFGMGAGILAQALGARAYRCSAREQGLLFIRPWEEGAAHPLLRGLERGFYAFMGHSDHYALPAGQSLAHTALSPHAMFASDEAPCVGYQFHPEYTPDLAARKYGRLLQSPHSIDLYPVFERLMDNAIEWLFSPARRKGRLARQKA